jgi:predicted PP-loop superfamily ATPase
MKAETILQVLAEIREELDLRRGTEPRISQVCTHADGSTHIIMSDRSEKSLMLGPGGRIVAELSRRINSPISVYSEEELILRKHRLELTLDRITELMNELTSDIQRDSLQILQSSIGEEMKFPQEMVNYPQLIHDQISVAVAFSGGADSSASMVILKKLGFEPEAIIIDLGPEFVNPRDLKKALDWCETQGIQWLKVSPLRKMENIIRRTQDGKIHPCGECHSIIIESVSKLASENGHSLLVTGELLPTGRQAIELTNSLLTIHLPASLALTKYRTEMIAATSGIHANQRTFGCLLVNQSHAFGWRSAGPSVFRVLRELEAGVLTTGQAQEYIKSIVKSKQLKRSKW